MSDVEDNSAGQQEGDEDGASDPRFDALIDAIADGQSIDWQEAEATAANDEERERIRSLEAISEIATFHRAWLAEAGLTGSLDDDEEEPAEIPDRWGELEILERIGRGSFGDVYKAREPRLDRIVALKLIRPSRRRSEREEETLREGRLLARVRHPNVATVHGAAGAEGRVGFWMEFLEGKNLAQLFEEKGRFEPREAAEIGVSLCRALMAVHGQGIVHRDVKAQNVVREEDGRIVLTDFGVGRDVRLDGEETSLSGTPLYLAPELFEGEAPSPASDLYALGVLLFYLVTGEFPISGGSLDELRAAHRERERRWLKEVRKDLPGTFVAAVERALDRDPKKRGDETQLERELGRFLGERQERKRKIRRSLLVVAILALIALAAVWILRARDRRELAIAMEALKQADEFAREGRMQEAIPYLETARRHYPKLPGIYWRWMSFQSADGNYTSAFEAAEVSEPLCRNSPSRDCHLVRAWKAVLFLDYREAIREFRAVGDIRGDDEVKKQIAFALLNLGSPDQAMRYAEEIQNSEGETEASLFATVLSAAGQGQKALALLPDLKRRFSPDPNVFWLEGTILMAMGNVTGAERVFSDMASRPLDPGDSSTANILLAKSLMYQLKYREALTALIASSNVDNQESFTRNAAVRSILIARCLVRLRRPDDASEKLSQILQWPHLPTNLKIFRNAAMVSLEAGNIALATRFAGIVRGLAQDYESDLSTSFDRQLQGELALRRGEVHLAMDASQDAMDLRGDPQIALSRARVLKAENRCDSARDVLQGRVLEKRGLIVEDFYTSWTIYNDALELMAKCSAN